MNDVVEDGRVVRAVKAGDTEAYRFLVERYQKPVYNLMLRMTGSREDAADLAQEAFIKAYEKLEQFREDRRFFPWLYSIAINHARNFLRRTKASVSLFAENADLQWEADESCTEERLHAAADAAVLGECLMRLPEDYREALLLRYREECTMEEIAQALGISLSGAKMRVHRGLRKLKAEVVRSSHDEKAVCSV